MSNNFFNCLTTLQQAEYLSSQGYYLHTRQEPGFIVDMYELLGLNVEVYFDKVYEDFVVIKSPLSNENVIYEQLANAPLHALSMSKKSYCYLNY